MKKKSVKASIDGVDGLQEKLPLKKD